ncbi:GNAT family N-acetyltransferase [Haloarcula nitratireducens]|uniref:GNAT family N-acetyltransferase n=1 Tax=Haloarcula nitratireducens TaxID=2487749 RepID=A0AAW4P941_9EURY|nr:GNAT family N-acetyltransferase [Halomicroarcula nitratireducens]MBX0294452.1 GNAT family N-acetyltransferase [Halomicroarcula nitratireducens]
MEITTATTDDVDAVVDLWVELARDQRAHGSHLLADENRTTVREATLQRVVAEDLLVARVDGAIVGFVMLTIERGRYEQRRVRGLVENIYVSPAYRRRGIGSALLGAAEATLTEAGADVVALEALAENDAARQFYAAHGYTPHRVELEKPTESDTL